jgi:hypothetical protein
MGLRYKSKETVPVTIELLVELVAACDAAGSPLIGTAAMISWFWMLRETDVLTRFDWTKYQAENGIAKVWHHKTGAEVETPLFDDDGSALWPEVMTHLERAPRLGTLVVMRDQPDARKGIHLSWNEHTLRHRLKEIRNAAGLPAEAKFIGLRHGGHTAAADAELTDAQLRALSGRRTASVTQIYAKPTMRQRAVAARKMRDQRTKTGGLSE